MARLLLPARVKISQTASYRQNVVITPHFAAKSTASKISYLTPDVPACSDSTVQLALGGIFHFKFRQRHEALSIWGCRPKWYPQKYPQSKWLWVHGTGHSGTLGRVSGWVKIFDIAWKVVSRGRYRTKRDVRFGLGVVAGAEFHRCRTRFLINDHALASQIGSNSI